jgi:hypothetical protein
MKKLFTAAMYEDVRNKNFQGIKCIQKHLKLDNLVETNFIRVALLFKLVSIYEPYAIT